RPDEGRAALLHGRALESLHDYDRSLTDYDEAAPSFLDTADERNRAAALAGHGRICVTIGDYVCAQYFLPQALKIQSTANDQKGVVATSISLAEAFNGAGQEQAALRTLGDVQKQADILRDESLQARALHALAVSQTRVRQYEQARASFERALALQRKNRDRGAEAATLRDMGELYSEMGRLDQALENQKAAFQIFAELDDAIGKTLAQQRGGVVQHKKKDYTAAADNFIQSIDIFEKQRSDIGADSNMRISFSVRFASA